MTGVFITGTGTDLGKTLVTTTLCWQLRQLGKKITAIKPIMSGFSPEDPKSDAALILKSCGLLPTPELIKTITPWHFRAPLSPHMAAAREDKYITLEQVVNFCKDHIGLQTDIILAEGAGGVMSPINEKNTMLDCMAALKWPVILVTGHYLGSISHTLTAIEALRSRNLPIRALIINATEKSAVPLDDTAETIKNLMPSEIPVLRIPRVLQTEELWKYMPPISWIVE